MIWVDKKESSWHYATTITTYKFVKYVFKTFIIDGSKKYIKKIITASMLPAVLETF